MSETENACFFYGTLMSFKVLSRVIYRTTDPDPWLFQDLQIKEAILHGYCRHQVRFADYPGIIAEAGKSVKGMYVTGLRDMEIRRLDTFEGDEYTREVVTARLLNPDGTEGEDVQCSAYVYRDESNLIKEEWDFDAFVAEKLHRWVGASKEYDEVDQIDPTGGRQWMTVASIGARKVVEVAVQDELKAAV
ncbi:hypothetical protein FN846DRAFT_958066 [Sphaerosporella brunnea]|uniref:Putative gamma-glutamylcyclotransferase n=1 Tax=Sphaerosporella brunnea TaxID=1250544 RepID=A0A5J5ERS0_9PEZI|nr:hypothetical protein FN846DRAFT_958066 [Sphaerosporella brunnea]